MKKKEEGDRAILKRGQILSLIIVPPQISAGANRQKTGKIAMRGKNQKRKRNPRKHRFNFEGKLFQNPISPPVSNRPSAEKPSNRLDSLDGRVLLTPPTTEPSREDFNGSSSPRSCLTSRLSLSWVLSRSVYDWARVRCLASSSSSCSSRC